MRFDFREPKYKPPKTFQVEWDNFKGGVNTLLRQTEIKSNELAKADNLKLVGRGVPTKREGTDDYFTTSPSVATGAQAVRGLKGVRFASGVSGVNELLALSDYGFLVKKNGTSHTIIPGYSYASGYPAELVQVYNNVYITNGQDVLTKYGGVSISSFTQISRPTNVLATNLSGVSGTFTRSFRVSAMNDVGETIASDAVLIQNTPQDLTETSIRLTWTTASPASVVKGYTIYGTEQGDERLITTVDNTTLTYDYVGLPEPSQLVYPPAADTTQGPKAKYVITHKDKLVLGNIDGYPSRISWSGGGANIDKFNWRYGGGYVDIDKDTGDRITGLIEFQDSIIVFKELSIWQVTLAASGALVIPTVKMLIRGVGAVSHKSIKHVENDVFFLSRRGVYTLGNEANYLSNVLRTNELSAKIRPVFSTLSSAQLEKACAVYYDNKYRLSYPIGSSAVNNREVIYDRERLAWMGPNEYPATPGVYEVYYDGNNTANLIWGDANDSSVTVQDSTKSNDKGVKIATKLVTKKESFKNTFGFKFIKNIYSNWRNIFGSPFVNVILETRQGTTTTASDFTIQAANTGTGFGFDLFGTTPFGNTGGAGSSTSSNDLVTKTRIDKIARTIQLEITTSGNNDVYELLTVNITARELGTAKEPTSWRTN